jgi:ketosteroid isomerase-like protein
LAGSTTTATVAPGKVSSPAKQGSEEVGKVNEQEVRELFFERLQHLSAEAEYELRHPDYVMEMPQSDERIRGRVNMRAFQEAYPNPPSIQPRRVVGSGDVWVIEGRSDYGDGQIYHVAMIVEFRDGKIWRDTRYYAEPFQAPEWRAQWVEPMEESPAPGVTST